MKLQFLICFVMSSTNLFSSQPENGLSNVTQRSLNERSDLSSNEDERGLQTSDVPLTANSYRDNEGETCCQGSFSTNSTCCWGCNPYALPICCLGPCHTCCCSDEAKGKGRLITSYAVLCRMKTFCKDKRCSNEGSSTAQAPQVHGMDEK